MKPLCTTSFLPLRKFRVTAACYSPLQKMVYGGVLSYMLYKIAFLGAPRPTVKIPSPVLLLLYIKIAAGRPFEPIAKKRVVGALHYPVQKIGLWGF
jgi:hypothetical protein